VEATATATTTRSDKAGLAALVAGICFVVSAIGSAAFDGLWVAMLVGFALLVYAAPQIHRHQAPADGPLGLWGSRLISFGGALVLLLGVVFLVWEAVGTPPEEGPIGALWMLGFFGFVIGIILFTIGTLRARVLPPAAAVLMLVGLLGSLAIDMATGAFFEDEGGGTTEWGFYVGVPIFGLGLAWLGYSLWKQRAGTTEPAATAL